MSEKVNATETEEPPSTTSWSSPSGLDLNPRPPETVRISRRASIALVAVAVILLGLFAYGGWKRRQRQVATYADANLPKRVAPATSAAADIENQVPAGNVPTTGARPAAPQTGQLQAPEQVPGYGSNPALAARNAVPQTSPVYIRQAAAISPVTTPVSEVHQPTPEEQRLQAAYESEQRAMTAPTGIDSGLGGVGAGAVSNSWYQLASAQQTIPLTRPGTSSTSDEQKSSLSPQESFVKSARNAAPDDYLKSTRTAPISPYEIKAGWEIPAVMEQGLDSDLPGEVKALVTSNVYDTATGQYVLIPQGSRLVGEYKSRVGYGQDGVQVVWNRLIYPDGSSLDLSGMVGQDEHGFSGFRDKVDHHYKRLVGFAVLTSLFAAASDISQNQNRSVLVYPSPGEVAGSAVGQQVSDLGSQITRKNLNVQPTVKIPVGYRFNVRVNRDVVFESEYPN